MDQKDILKELASLAQLDIDAVRAYESALKNIEAQSIHHEISGFRDDHRRHIENLSTLIRRFGAEPPSQSPDVKGFFIQGFTEIRSATGTEGALKAMKTNETLTNRDYARAVALDLPADVKAVVQRNYDDERRHLHAIEQWLNTRAWEQAGAHA